MTDGIACSFACSWSYAGGSVAIDRSKLVEQVETEGPNEVHMGGVSLIFFQAENIFLKADDYHKISSVQQIEWLKTAWNCKSTEKRVRKILTRFSWQEFAVGHWSYHFHKDKRNKTIHFDCNLLFVIVSLRNIFLKIILGNGSLLRIVRVFV